MALYITVYLALMGKQGLKEVNQLSYSGAHYLADRLTATPHFTMRYPGKPFLNEFAVRVDGDIDALQRQLREAQGVQFGLKIAPDTLLLCVTETISKQDIDNVVEMCNHVIEREEIENE